MCDDFSDLPIFKRKYVSNIVSKGIHLHAHVMNTGNRVEAGASVMEHLKLDATGKRAFAMQSSDLTEKAERALADL